MRLFQQDKEHNAEVTAFLKKVVRGGPPLVPPDELWNVTEASFAAVEAARSGAKVTLADSTAAPPSPSGVHVGPPSTAAHFVAAVPLAPR